MQKQFNISADCKPELHYMVNLEDRLLQIKAMIDRGEYFTINRARQFGKTTLLRALSQFIKNDYLVASLDFQMFSSAKFKDEHTFSLAFAKMFLRMTQIEYAQEKEIVNSARDALNRALENKEEKIELFELFEYLSAICKEEKKPIVLLIDEVDSAANNQVFLDFLSQLRGYYINRDKIPTFFSVILSGVYDIKNIKYKIQPGNEHRLNSPWNISVDFLVDMSFSSKDIMGMLNEYEAEHQTGMDIESIACLIYDYTSGYPFLVSKICKLIDENTSEHTNFSWTKKGVLEAVKILLSEPNTLFESLINKLEDYPELKEMLWNLLFKGREITYVIGIHSIEIALMFGFVKKSNHTVVIANRIFETLLYNLFLASPIMQQNQIYDAATKEKNQFICNGHLNMEKILERFVLHFDELYGDNQKVFLEDDGRRYFLLYLKPIINGTGNYYIEAQTRNHERTDVIVDYGGEQFIIELKIWRGNTYHERGEEQLASYLDYYNKNKGYMISFNFNKKKQIGVKRIQIRDKILIEAVV